MRKIVHISDPHVGHVGYRERYTCAKRFDSLVGVMLATFRPPENYVIVVTGDLVDDAMARDSESKLVNYERARRILERFPRQSADAPGYYVLAVPGNHDYLAKKPGRGKYARPDRIDDFRACFLDGYAGPFPKVDPIEGVVFVGLDSMEGEFIDENGHRADCDHWAANGRIGEVQMAKLESDLPDTDRDKTVVYLHHHPLDPFFPTLELKDSKALKRALLGKGVDALLYGHNHLHLRSKYNQYNRHSGWDVPLCHDAGSATKKAGAKGYCLEIDFSLDKPVKAHKIKYKGNRAYIKD